MHKICINIHQKTLYFSGEVVYYRKRQKINEKIF